MTDSGNLNNMIRPEKITSALYALHLILVRARFLALRRESPEDVATLLDYAEALPRMFMSEEDMTETYREYIQGVAEQFPYCRYILDKFDAEPPEKW